MRIRLHAFEAASRANGPGLRAVVWLQGCSLRCESCFNPETHDPAGGYQSTTKQLIDLIRGSSTIEGIEGLSISGGEPFDQPEALRDVVRQARNLGLGILIFTGHTLQALGRVPLASEILASTDVLIAGPYLRSQHLGSGLLGSGNQRIHCLTERYRPADFSRIPKREVILHRDGTYTLTGVSPGSRPPLLISTTK
jgi:anaerobic ribonucleoside-triphosphate reductase activating protein